VTRVAQSSPAGIAGLAPGDVIVSETVRGIPKSLNTKKDILRQIDSFVWEVVVRGANGRPRTVPIEHVLPSEEWIPGCMSYLSDGVRWHFGLGPFDLLFHTSSRPSFTNGSDPSQRIDRLSILTVFQWDRTSGAGGSYVRGAFQPIVDVERAAYYKEWLDGVPFDFERFHLDKMGQGQKR
jgi:hypothetical protein